MSQGAAFLDTTGVYSGLTAANRQNVALDALLTANSGATAPTNALGGSPKLGQVWIDTTSATLPIKKRYTGLAWVVEAVMDVTNGLWLPVVGGGIGTIASATTTDIGSQPQSTLNVTGTTTIAGLGSSAAVGQKKNLIFGGILTLTYNATSLIIPGAANITTANGDVAEVVYLGGGNWRVLHYVPISLPTKATPTISDFVLIQDAAASNAPKKSLISALPFDPVNFTGYLSGLTLSAAGSTATFGIAAGVANDTANGGLMSLASAYTKTTAAWAVGTGNGALDTGVIVINTGYHVYEIKRPDTGVVDICVSLSAAAPTLGAAIPAAYTLSRRIGWMKTDGASQWIKFTQTGDDFIWAAFVPDVSGIAATVARVITPVTVPTGVVVKALLKASINATSGTSTNVCSLLENDAAVSTGTNTNLQAGNNGISSVQLEVMTNTSAQIAVRSGTAGAATISIQTYGWKDTRGK
jgi:hypothetical protein